jgi:hypothetical protein
MPISIVAATLPVGSSIGLAQATNAASASAPAAATLSTTPGDTVTLSQGAQQFLSAVPVAPPGGSSQPDAIAQAIAVLNTADGSVSVDDQLQAYDLTVNFAKGATANSSNVFDPSKTDAMVALLDSPLFHCGKRRFIRRCGQRSRQGPGGPDVTKINLQRRLC